MAIWAKRLGLILFGIGIHTPAGRADAIADFYKATPITLVVSSAPGGGYDAYARILAQFIGTHIPGAPTVIVKNMPGAAGATAANYVYNVAPKDGSTIVMPQNTLTIDQFTSSPAVHFDMRKFEWLGSMNVIDTICIFPASVGPLKGRAVLDRELRVGASGGVTGSPALIPSLINQVAGSKLRIINGYAGTAETMLAVDRGEVDGLCGIGWDSARVQMIDRIRRGALIVGLDVGNRPDAELEALDTPFLLDFIPDGVDRKALVLLLSPQDYGRPFAMAPGTPPDRLAAVRNAFEATMNDPSFRSKASVLGVQVNPVSAAEVSSEINQMFDSPPEIQERAHALLREAGWP